ncbi:hypothetical protein [Kribbella monticola]|uniref:hypothetical protein n=1 Tax=Kribbella monticola TaxID=2185285 RepID=UPI000DD4485D|nr:hypothetical protein [Kribbella monticola]
MRWQELSAGDAGYWAAEQMSRSDPLPTMVFAPVERQVAEARQLLAQRGLPGDVLSWSGTVRMRSEYGESASEWEAAMEYLAMTESSRDFDVDSEDELPGFVTRQVSTRLYEWQSIGPGGRVTAYDLPHAHFVDVTVRPLVTRIRGGRWRPPEQVETAVRAMVGPARDYRLRAVFGYPEPSAYEAANLVRPAFVFVLDGPSDGEGPRWRVGIAVPATFGGEGDAEPDDDGGDMDSDWCV